MDQTSMPVVLGYNGSPEADRAFAWAARAARLQRLPLEVLVVATHMDPVFGHLREIDDRRVALWSQRAERLLARERLADAQVVTRRGPTAPVLVTAAKSAALLVVGSYGHSLAVGPLGGSVSQHLARHAPCPVVVVRPAQQPYARQIVVGVDGSPESIEALLFGCRRATLTGEPITAVVAYPAAPVPGAGIEGFTPPRTAARKEAAEGVLAEARALTRASFPGLKVDGEAVPVGPGHLLVDRSADASLVIVGSRGSDAVTDLVLGSVTQFVLHHAACPVAVVPRTR